MIAKAIHIVLAVQVLIASIGIGVDRHFCGKLLQSVALFTEADSCCGMTKEQEPMDCCHNEGEFLQTDQQDLPSEFHWDFSSAFTWEPLPSFLFARNTFLKSETIIAGFSITRPPPLPAIPLFKRVMSFRL